MIIPPTIDPFLILFQLQVIETFHHIYGLESFQKPTDVPVFALRAKYFSLFFWTSGYHDYQLVAKVVDVQANQTCFKATTKFVHTAHTSSRLLVFRGISSRFVSPFHFSFSPFHFSFSPFLSSFYQCNLYALFGEFPMCIFLLHFEVHFLLHLVYKLSTFVPSHFHTSMQVIFCILLCVFQVAQDL